MFEDSESYAPRWLRSCLNAYALYQFKEDFPVSGKATAMV